MFEPMRVDESVAFQKFIQQKKQPKYSTAF